MNAPSQFSEFAQAGRDGAADAGILNGIEYHAGDDGTGDDGTLCRSGWFKRRFENWSLAAKLRLVVFGVAAIPFGVAAVLLVLFGYFGQAGSQQAERVRAEVLVAEAAIIMEQTSTALHQAQETQSDELLRSAQVKAERASDRLTRAIQFGEGRYPASSIAQWRAARDDIKRKSAAINTLDASAQPQEIAQLEAEVSQSAAELIVNFEAARRHALQSIDGIMAGIMVGFAVCVGLMLSAIVASTFGARTMIAHIVGQITDITQSMDKVAAGDIDAPIPGGNRRDEIGAMARALGVFQARSLTLRDLTDNRARDAEKQLAQQQLVSRQMYELRRDKSQLLEGLADGFEVSVGDLINAVSAASEQLKATSRQMEELAEGSNDQAQLASDAVERAAANVSAAAASTDEFALSINEISRQAAASAQLARGASELVTTANAKMTDLSQAALEIGEIAGLIQTIAQRTNLLALNASIEAARGGEAGRGFAVVASEVKELAMQTSSATRSVTDKITAMQSYTRSSASDLGGIVARITELEHAASTIAAAVDQQSVSGEQLARNIDTVAEGSVQVSKRLGVLREASEKTGTAAEDVVQSAMALGEHANDLREKAGRFIADVRRSARDLEASEGDLELAAPKTETGL